jgi:IS30 family transposase
MKGSLVKNPRIAYTRGVRVDIELLQRPVNARFLNLQERELIHDLHIRGTSMRSIALMLGRSASTISREFHRNQQHGVGCLPYAAHRAAAIRRLRPKTRNLHHHGRLRDYVSGMLLEKWSPEQVSNRLIKDFPADQEMRVPHETIYQALYVQGRDALTRYVIGYSGFKERVMEFSKGEGANVVYDGIGKNTFDEGLSSVRRRAHLWSMDIPADPYHHLI